MATVLSVGSHCCFQIFHSVAFKEKQFDFSLTSNCKHLQSKNSQKPILKKLVMAQFTAQGRVKSLFNGEGVSFGLEPKDPFHKLLRSFQPHKRRLRFSGSTTRLYSYLSSMNKHNHLTAEARLSAGDESVNRDNEVKLDDDDEFVTDELACFRGLVLDISYRSILILTNFLFTLVVCSINFLLIDSFLYD